MEKKLKLGFINKLEEVKGLSKEEYLRISNIAKRFPFFSSKYYLSLINWNDPRDPIKRVVIPHPEELKKHGRLDPSDEKNYTIFPGLQHKYRNTAVFLISNACFGFCRYCFRKRIFKKDHIVVLEDVERAIEYVRKDKKITNVLLTGGDALALSTARLEKVIKKLREIDHIEIIRLGTRALSYYPQRVISDSDLLKVLKRYSTDEKKVYVMTHFVHPRELTPIAIKAANLLLDSGAILANQAPLLKGINDRPEVLAELFKKLSSVGVVPYYIFQCRPAIGNKPYTVPIERGYEIFEKAKVYVSGLAKRSRFVMSHATGKLEIVGKTKKHVYLKYLQAAHHKDYGKFLILKSNPDAYWLEDYKIITTHHLDETYRLKEDKIEVFYSGHA